MEARVYEWLAFASQKPICGRHILCQLAVYYVAICPPLMQLIAAMQANFGDNEYLNTLFTAFRYVTQLSGLIALGAMLGWLYINSKKREDWI